MYLFISNIIRYEISFFIFFYRKNSLQKKMFSFCRLSKNYWTTWCTHVTSLAIWLDEIMELLISIKKINETLNILKNSFFKTNFRWFFGFCHYVYQCKILVGFSLVWKIVGSWFVFGKKIFMNVQSYFSIDMIKRT